MGSLAAISARISSNAAARYIVALSAAVLAVAARWLLSPILGYYLPYVTLYPAIAFGAWFCGVGPSVLLTVVGIVGARYFIVVPRYSLSIPDVPQGAGLLVLGAGAAVIIAIGELVRRDSASLQRAQSDLEERGHHLTPERAPANHKPGERAARVRHVQDEERRRIAREL